MFSFLFIIFRRRVLLLTLLPPIDQQQYWSSRDPMLVEIVEILSTTSCEAINIEDDQSSSRQTQLGFLLPLLVMGPNGSIHLSSIFRRSQVLLLFLFSLFVPFCLSALHFTGLRPCNDTESLRCIRQHAWKGKAWLTRPEGNRGSFGIRNFNCVPMEKLVRQFCYGYWNFDWWMGT